MSGQWWESDLIVGPFTNLAAANAWAAANPSSLFPGLLATAGGVQYKWDGSAWEGMGGGGGAAIGPFANQPALDAWGTANPASLVEGLLATVGPYPYVTKIYQGLTRGWVRRGVNNPLDKFVIFGSSTMAYGSNGDVGAGTNISYGSPVIHALGRLGKIDVVKNYAVAGTTAATILTAISNCPSGIADWAVIHLGGNDLTVGAITGAQCLDYFDTARTAMRSKGAKYIIAVIPHAKMTADGNTLAIYNEIKAYRAGLASRMAADADMRIVDHAEAIRDVTSATGDSLASCMSGIHMNAFGHIYASNEWIRILLPDFGHEWDETLASAGTVEHDLMANAGASVSGMTRYAQDLPNGGIRLISSAGNSFLTTVIPKASLSASKTYRLVMSIKCLASVQAAGMYFRDNTSSNIWSIGRYTLASQANPDGTSLNLISQRIKIPQAVIDSAASFTLGIALTGVTAVADFTVAALVSE